MMSANDLSHQVDAYHEWKSRLAVEIQNYQTWLLKNGLSSDDIERRLARGLTLIQNDELTIAMVGEYSRGKTELINALVFADFGQRMLSSQAVRTTMCPTEIFHDAHRAESYLNLLPIETRIQNLSIQELKEDHAAWQEVSIDTSDPEKMSHTLKQVAATRVATIAEARSLGFDEQMLERVPNHTGYSGSECLRFRT